MHTVATIATLLLAQVAVKDASITKIFGDSWATELKAFAGTLPKAEQTQLAVYLQRLELTKYVVHRHIVRILSRATAIEESATASYSKLTQESATYFLIVLQVYQGRTYYLRHSFCGTWPGCRNDRSM